MGIIEIIATLGGMVLPPAVDFLKKKFLKPSSDTPEATMSALATTNPEVLPQYMTAMSGWLEAQTKYFNRDVVALVADTIPGLAPLDQGTRCGMFAIVGNWFGARITGGE